MMEDWDPERLESAITAMEQGRYEDGFALLESIDPDCPNRWLIAGEAWMDFGDLERIEECRDKASALLGAGDPEVLWLDAQLCFLAWKPAAALAILERLLEAEERDTYLELLAKTYELQGNYERADELYQRAHEIRPEIPAPPRLSPEEFENVVNEAAQDLPREFRDGLDQTIVVIDPMPSAELMQAPESGHPPTAFGLFVGAPFTEIGTRQTGDLPARIYLFQRNLERSVWDRDELREQIRITLYHELGHALGFDEDELDEMGLA